MNPWSHWLCNHSMSWKIRCFFRVYAKWTIPFEPWTKADELQKDLWGSSWIWAAPGAFGKALSVGQPKWWCATRVHSWSIHELKAEAAYNRRDHHAVLNCLSYAADPDSFRRLWRCDHFQSGVPHVEVLRRLGACCSKQQPAAGVSRLHYRVPARASELALCDLADAVETPFFAPPVLRRTSWDPRLACVATCQTCCCYAFVQAVD